MNVLKNVKKKLQKKKSFIVFEEASFKPFKHTMTFSAIFFFLNLFSTFMKNSSNTNSRFFHKNMHIIIKKKDIFDHKVFKLQRCSKVFPNLGENAIFWRDHSSKNLLKPWIRLQVFFLSSLAYTLVNLLVVKRNSCKMSKNWFFLQLLVWDLTLPMNLKSVLVYIVQ